MAHNPSTDYREDELQMARYAKALSHPARIAILRFLVRQNACFCGEIVDELPIAQATVSQHLKELKKSGLIKGSIEPPKVKYCIDPEHWGKAKSLLNDFLDKRK
jgi:ArsR family transcriptional regulator, arsenate/arsenite/antimonite-responsive transcriptional repressor